MPVPRATKPSRYEEIAEVVARVVGRLEGVSQKKGVSGRAQFFSGERLFAFIATDGVALKLPADVVTETVDGTDYLPFKMRNKPVLREWIRIRHEDAAAYKNDAALFRQAIRFVRAPKARREPVAPEDRVPAARPRAG
jgi:hypothetical protein